MSGAKAAQVRPKIQKAIETAQKSLKIAEKNNEWLFSLNNLNSSSSEAQAVALSSDLEQKIVSDAAQRYCAEDVRFLEEQKQRISQCIAEGKAESQKAAQLRREAETLHARAVQIMAEVAQTGEQLAQALAKKSWYLDHEDAMAANARRQANDALRMERESADKLRQALDHARLAKNAFDSVLSVGGQIRQNAAQLEKTAAERELAAKIAEENQRKAVSSESEINGIITSVQSLNHEKFCPGEFRAFSSDLTAFQKSMKAGDFTAASHTGETLLLRLREFYQKTSSLQSSFEAAQIAARNSLELAQAEIKQLNREEILRWIPDKDEFSAALLQISSAHELIQREMFTDAEKNIAVGLKSIRDNVQKSEMNKAASEQRFALAEVIMDALYEQGYDSPTYYYTKQNSDSSDVEFSDLTVFAKSPGKKGDMRLNIDLVGNVKLEVEGIADGEEAVCHQLIQDLQKGVGNEIDFQMTDWGRASRVDTNAKIAIRNQEKSQQKTRERQNG